LLRFALKMLLLILMFKSPKTSDSIYFTFGFILYLPNTAKTAAVWANLSTAK